MSSISSPERECEPADPFAGMNWSPRPYQIIAVNRCRDFLRQGNRAALMVLPTGTGKTIAFAAITRLAVNKGGRVLILAHRDELIEQAANKLAASAGLDAAIEKADRHARRDWSLMHGGEPAVVVGSVQTMRAKRLQSWPRDYFSLVIVDEGHHVVAQSYLDILDHFRKARVVGVTATADRSDGEDLGQVFHGIAYEFSLRDAIDQGYLCPIRTVKLDVGVDLADIRTTRRGGDFSDEDLAALIGPHVETLANATVNEIGDEPTIIFTPDTGSAEAFASALVKLGINAASISYRDPEQRKRIVRAFQNREVQAVANCGILTEGFDAPHTSRIVMCRPTKSRSLYAQCLGRGTRLFDNKPECVVIDFTWGCDRHELVQPAHLLATPDDPPELFAIVESLCKADPELELADAVDQGRAEVDRRRRAFEVDARRKAVKVIERREFDPVGVQVERFLGIPSARKDRSGKRATEKQVATLAKFGIPDTEDWSRPRATAMLDILIERAKKGQGSWKQVRYAVHLGMSEDAAREASRAEVSEFIDRSRRPSEVYA
jgi:superfamily II DNA or RNA helicase